VHEKYNPEYLHKLVLTLFAGDHNRHVVGYVATANRRVSASAL
jgi:hypothetical protein